MVKVNKTISLDFSLVEEAKRQGLTLSIVLNNLLSEHLHLNASPGVKLKEVERLNSEAERLASEANEVLSAEEKERDRIHELAEADQTKADAIRAEHEKKVESELANLREQLKNSCNEDVETMFKEAWNNRDEPTRAYRAAFSIYMEERELR